MGVRPWGLARFAEPGVGFSAREALVRASTVHGRRSRRRARRRRALHPWPSDPRKTEVTMFAIISDLHSNEAALRAVLADIASQKIDRIICLGDVVGYG